MISKRTASVVVLGLLAASIVAPSILNAADGSLSDIRAAYVNAENKGATAVKGKQGWIFFVPELRTLTVGKYWGADAAKVSKASSKSDADPLPAILDFKSQLDKAGIDLIVVPVPAKATIYPEMLSGKQSSGRNDVYQQEFYKILKAKGVKLLDLTPAFLKAKSQNLYCKQDSHWSGKGCEVAAKTISESIKGRSWMKSVPRRQFSTASSSASITGDLNEMLGSPYPKEKLPVVAVREKSGGSVEPWRQSPVLLLGDSHNLVFQAGGDMYASGAGLAGHISKNIGFPVDLIAVRGSGATPARINLLRRKDNMKGKKLVIWCFSVREFTEGSGWKKVPVIR